MCNTNEKSDDNKLNIEIDEYIISDFDNAKTYDKSTRKHNPNIDKILFENNSNSSFGIIKRSNKRKRGKSILSILE